MPKKAELRGFDFIWRVGFSRVLEVITDVYLSTDSLGSYDVVTLRHISRLINFPRVVDLDLLRKLLFSFER